MTCFSLLVVILAYLFVGALIFRALERPGAVRASENFDAVLRRLASENDCVNESEVVELMNVVMTAIGEGGYADGHPYACHLIKGTVNESYYSDNWGVAHSFVFATTVVTTMGRYLKIMPCARGVISCVSLSALISLRKAIISKQQLILYKAFLFPFCTLNLTNFTLGFKGRCRLRDRPYHSLT